LVKQQGLFPFSATSWKQN